MNSEIFFDLLLGKIFQTGVGYSENHVPIRYIYIVVVVVKAFYKLFIYMDLYLNF